MLREKVGGPAPQMVRACPPPPPLPPSYNINKLVCKFTLLVMSPESNPWHRFYSLSFFIQWNACLHMTCDGHVRGNFNDYFSWNNGMCSQLILRANSLKYVPQLFFMVTCSSATAMQCSVKIVSELFLGHQLISFDKIFSLRKNRIVLQHAR